MKYVILALMLAGCLGGEHRDARDKYNEGIAALQKGDFDAAAKALVEARSQAGVDPELRFRAAYDLGIAYGANADKIRKTPEPDLAKALELAQQAASWFNDASRQRPTDEASKTNAAIMRARVQAISDQLRKGEGKLEARIDLAIKEQRGVLDGVRQAWLAIKKAGGSDPLAQQGTLTHLADLERAIVAEVGAITDLAAEEIDAIGKKPEDKRSDEEKVRVVQLKAVDIYLLEARARIAEARRKLQELAAEGGLGRAEAALIALKRGREQLLDPINVMKMVAQDELEVIRDTAQAGGASALVLEAKPDAVPAWLEPPVIAERQGGLHDRIEEVHARLAAATGAPPDAAAKPDPQRDKLIARVKTALPFVVTASGAMDQARQALAQSQMKPALDREREAITALARAIEEFADLKQTIELAYAEQEQLVALLSPEGAKQVPAAIDRARETREGLARNIERMPRLKELIADEAAQVAQQEQEVAAKAAAAPPPGAGSGSAGAGSGSAASPEAAKLDAAKQQLAQARQQLTRAEELRGQAQAALDQLATALAGTRTDPIPPAGEARQKIEELRKLFFSVIEHLQQLIRDQGETRDQTSAAHADDELARMPKLPGLVTREGQHGAMAKAITDALAKQADAAGKQPPQPGQPDGKVFSAAADEVRLAQKEMTDASGTLVKARDAKTSSESIQPAIKSQATAIEHLENALRLLQPPKKGQQDQQQQQQQQQQQKPEKQQSPAGAGQSARDQDAQQQKKRHDQNAAGDPVEKDW